MQEASSDSINVLVRCRPLSEKEKHEGSKICLRTDDKNPNMLILDTKPDPKYFTFDHIANEQATQEQIFSIIGKPIANSCLEGYNCCIFAYGQTGAGKTYTMQGQGIETYTSVDLRENEKRGIVPRVLNHLFGQIMNDKQNKEYRVQCNFLEIYNEHIIDLFNTNSGSLQIREDSKKGVYVEGLTEEPSNTYEETIELLLRGNRNRHIGSTNMNIESSRSHSVFTVNIESKTAVGGMVNERTSRFSFVDLAGSERQKQTSTTGERLKEGCNINKSLSVLGNVINALVDVAEGKTRHIHYRDSKLTFILRDSLGGNSKTALIANVSPDYSSFGETLSTLKFAQRAKLIRNKASINEDSTGTVDSLKQEVKKQREEISRLQELFKLHKTAIISDSASSLTVNLSSPTALSKEVFGEERKVEQASEMKALIKQSLEVLSESELHLKSELAKRDETIEQLRKIHEVFERNDLQMRMIIKLQNSKLERYRAALYEKFNSTNLTELMEFERVQLLKENAGLYEILDSTPTVIRFMSENLKLFDNKLDPAVSARTTEDSRENKEMKQKLALLQELTSKLSDNLKLNSKESNSSPKSEGVGSWEGKLESVKSEYNEKIEQLNVEVFESERLLHSVQLDLEKEKQLNEHLRKELGGIKQQREKAEEEHEKRVNELLATFDQIKETKLSLSEAEKENTDLNLKMLELTDKLRQEQARLEDFQRRLNEKEELIAEELKAREGLERQIKELVEAKLKDSLSFEQAINDLQIQISLLNREKESQKAELEEMMLERDTQKDLIRDLEFKAADNEERYEQQTELFKSRIYELEEANRNLNETAKQENTVLTEKVEKLQADTNELGSKLQQSEEERAVLATQLEGENREYNQRIEHERVQRVAEVEEIKTRASVEQQRLTIKLEESYSKLQECEVKLQGCQLQLEELNNEYSDMKEFAAIKEEELSKTNEEFIALKNELLEISEKAEEVARLKALVESEKEKSREFLALNYEKQERILGLEKQLKEQASTTTDEIERLKSNNEQLTLTLAANEQTLHALREENEDLANLLQKEREYYQLSLQNAHETAKQNEQLVTELQTGKDEIESICKGLQKEKQERLNKLQEQEELYREELDSLELKHTEELHKLYEERKNTFEQIALKKDTQLEEISNTYIKKLSEMQDELTRCLVRQQDLEKALEEKERAFLDIQKTNSDFKSQLKDTSKSHERYIRKQHDEIESLKKEVNKKNDQLLEANQMVASCRSEIQEWKANIELKNKELAHVRNAMQSMESAMQSLREQKRESWCDQENEIIELKEQYMKLRQEHKTLITSVGSKDSQIRAIKDEIKDLHAQIEGAKEDSKGVKQNEARLRKENQELNDKISRLNNEQYMLLMEIENLSKGGADIASNGQMTNEQKIRHLNKLKEENSRLKDEKLRMAEDLLKMQEQRDKLHKKLDELSRKSQTDSKFSGGESESSLKQELDKRTAETALYSDAFCKVIHLLQNGLTKEELRHYNLKSYDIENVLHVVQNYSNTMIEKNKYIHSKDTELEAALLKNSILEKELLLLKQKIQMKQQQSQQNHQACSGHLHHHSPMTHIQYTQNQNPNIPLSTKSSAVNYVSKSRSNSAQRQDSAERSSYKIVPTDENREDINRKPPRKSTGGLLAGEKRI